MEYKNALQSYTSYDYLPVECIPVIASFDSEGHIAPLYIRLEGASYKVDTYWIRTTSHRNIIEYNCKIVDNGFLKPLILSFHVNECVWTIPK